MAVEGEQSEDEDESDDDSESDYVPEESAHEEGAQEGEAVEEGEAPQIARRYHSRIQQDQAQRKKGAMQRRAQGAKKPQ